jgi:CheY-like chemotaxis protein
MATTLVGERGFLASSVTMVQTARNAPLRVLVSSGEPLDARLACNILEHDGHEASSVTSAGEAIAWLQNHLPDVVIASCRRGGALEILRAIRDDERLRHVPVILATGMPVLRSDALALGFDGFVAKPYPPSMLLRELKLVYGLTRDYTILLPHLLA